MKKPFPFGPAEGKEPKREERREAKMPAAKRALVERKEAKGYGRKK